MHSATPPASTLFGGHVAHTILIVSNDANRRTALQAVLNAQGTTAREAADDTEAFRCVREDQPDVLILDRFVNGAFAPAEICSLIKENPVFQATQIITVTRENSRDEVNDMIRARADSCITERFDPAEIKVHLEKVIQTRAMYRQMQSLNEKLQQMFVKVADLNREKERDLEAGGVFQKSIFPNQAVLNRELGNLGLEVHLLYRPFPGARVSGDFWDLFHFSETEIGLLLADAVGHGIPAAFYSLYTVSTLRRMIATPQTDYFARLSEELFRIMQGKHLAASFCILRKDSFAFTNAGLPAPIIVRGGRAESIEFFGPVIGGFPRTAAYGRLEVEFSPGDTLVLYTDGVTEAKNEHGEEFGTERLLEACAGQTGTATGTGRAIRTALDDFLEDGPGSDDTTMIVLRRVDGLA